MNKASYHFFVSVLFAGVCLLVSSCFKSSKAPKLKTIETEYASVYRLDSMAVYRGVAPGSGGFEDTTYLFIPQRCKFSLDQVSSGEAQRMQERWKKEAKAFYGAELQYKGLQYYIYIQMTAGHYDKVSVSAFDWRATSFDIISLTDWDTDHPAGSSVKEKFCLFYRKSDQPVSVLLSEFKYGDLMLSDGTLPSGADLWPYCPVYNGGLVLQLINPSDRERYLQADLEVRIETDFGTIYKATTSGDEQRIGLCNLNSFNWY